MQCRGAWQGKTGGAGRAASSKPSFPFYSILTTSPLAGAAHIQGLPSHYPYPKLHKTNQWTTLVITHPEFIFTHPISSQLPEVPPMSAGGIGKISKYKPQQLRSKCFCPHTILIEIWTPKMIGIRLWGQKNHNRISALTKEVQENLFLLASCEHNARNQQSTTLLLVPWFWTSQPPEQ